MNNKQQARAQAKKEAPAAPAPEPCLCRELLSQMRVLFGISPEVELHLNNSRIELLKAVRAMVDQRIAHLSGAGQQGTKIRVE